ncbi:hypothetical protein OS493_003666 [Desmophyllum pertusum]|uniref:Uncharacterized protein n=1 Tax=Desmophyllum pertusum TaxID=174260 RepID=A0A9X0A6M8_9CNID|nr:hypothetical protein OS493_003666 [Desmophyllum pertusum]
MADTPEENPLLLLCKAAGSMDIDAIDAGDDGNESSQTVTSAESSPTKLKDNKRPKKPSRQQSSMARKKITFCQVDSDSDVLIEEGNLMNTSKSRLHFQDLNK